MNGPLSYLKMPTSTGLNLTFPFETWRLTGEYIDVILRKPEGQGRPGWGGGLNSPVELKGHTRPDTEREGKEKATSAEGLVGALYIRNLRGRLEPRTPFFFLPAHPFLFQGKSWPGRLDTRIVERVGWKERVRADKRPKQIPQAEAAAGSPIMCFV